MEEAPGSGPDKSIQWSGSPGTRRAASLSHAPTLSCALPEAPLAPAGAAAPGMAQLSPAGHPFGCAQQDLDPQQAMEAPECAPGDPMGPNEAAGQEAAARRSARNAETAERMAETILA